MTRTILKKTILFVPALVLFLFLVTAGGCDSTPVQTQSEQQQVNDQQGVYNTNQPLRKYDYSPEKDELQQIYDSRMKVVNTWTVFYPRNAPVTMCPSRGFPIPYTTQLTNPMQIQSGSGSGSSYAMQAIPQAEPNGLYTGQTSATWVLCIRNGKITPQYAEEQVHAYTYPVTVDANGMVHDAGGDSSTEITIKNK
jgi:hypothetical protein